MSLLNPTKVSKAEKLKFFMLLDSLLGLGLTTLQSIEFVARNENSKSKRELFAKYIEGIKREGLKIEDVLKKMGYLEEIEYLILSQSKNAKNAIKDIIEFQERTKIFEKTVIGIFWFPFTTWFGILGLLIYGQPKIVGFIDYISEQNRLLKGTSLDIELPFFLQDWELLVIVFGVSVVTFLILFTTYHLTYKKAPWIIYKIFPLKNLDDSPIIFSTMVKLHDATGQSLAPIVEQMEMYVIPQALKDMFTIILERIFGNRFFFTVLKDFGFKKELVDFIEIGEKSQSLWKNLGHIVKLSKDLADQKIRVLNMTLKPMMHYISYGMIVTVLFEVFMLYFAITSAMMGNFMDTKTNKELSKESKINKLKLLKTNFRLKIKNISEKIKKNRFLLSFEESGFLFSDFKITKEIKAEEYIEKNQDEDDKKDKKEISMIYDIESGYYYLSEFNCYSFNQFANLFFMTTDDQSCLLILEDHVSSNKTRILFAYKIDNERIYDQSIVDSYSNFYKKDMDRIGFLMHYNLSTLDNIYIISDKDYFKLSEIKNFDTFSQIDKKLAIQTTQKMSPILLKKDKIKLALTILLIVIVLPIIFWFLFDFAIEDTKEYLIEQKNSITRDIKKIDLEIKKATGSNKDLLDEIKANNKEIYKLPN